MNFYKRWLGDYQKKTGHLSMLEHGAYNLLLDAFYATEFPLPGNKVELYRLLRAITKREREAVNSVLAQFWTLEAGNWLNKRAVEEIERASAQADTNRRIATEREAKRSTKRSTKRGTNRLTKGEPSHSHSQTLEPQPQLKTSSQGLPVVVAVPPELDTSVQSQTPRWVPAAKKNGKPRAASTETWEAYSNAYLNRYGVEPTRNARVNSQIKQFTKRVPLEEAPAIAAFYLTHNNAYYLRSSHSVASMLHDAEKLRTEWQTGRKVTNKRALQDEGTATNFDNAEEAKRILRRMDDDDQKRKDSGHADTHSGSLRDGS